MLQNLFLHVHWQSCSLVKEILISEFVPAAEATIVVSLRVCCFLVAFPV